MRVSIPTSVVDNTYTAFPEGTYTGALVSAEVKDPKDDGSWLLLKLGLDGISANEGTEDPGRSKFTADITLYTDGQNVAEIENFNADGVPFSLVRSSGLLAGIAEGLGVVTRDGTQVVVDLEQVIAALTDGNFEGERVSFEVSHYTPKGSDKTYEQFSAFGPAA